MLKNAILTVLLTVGLGIIALAQPDQSNNLFNQIAESNSNRQWFKIKPEQRVAKASFLEQTKNIFDLNHHNDFITTKTQTDELGWTHHRLQQTYQNVPIEGSDYILHEKDGVIHKTNGRVQPNISISTTPTLSEIDALQLLLQEINADEYAWENETMENSLQYQWEDEDATYYPEGKLLIYSLDEGETHQLVYQLDIYATIPHHYHSYYVDAHTGKIIEEVSLLCHATASTNYYGTVDITTQYDDGDDLYYLYNVAKNIETHDANNGLNLPSNPFTDINNSWTASYQKTACEAHWIAEQTHHYLLEEHNLYGYDGYGSKMMIWVHFGQALDNAFGGNGRIYFGDGDGIATGKMTCIDIVAHEYMHNVIQASSNLKPKQEPGALNESFADIFGAILEKELDPNNFDWTMGEDVFLNGSAFRSMSNPKAFGDPDTYQGQYWQNGGNDQGGIHTNSGVQNHWFYLLSEGGNGTNDNGQNYEVDGIGMNKAAKIAFRTVTQYLSKYSNYYDAYNTSIEAATDLYGASSEEVQQVQNAWCAVGVGPCDNASDGSLTITNPNGGEPLSQGINQTITWNKAGNTGNFVTLELSIDGGSNWIVIDDQVNNDGNYTWTVPPYVTTVALLQITSNDNPTIFDQSDDYFTIESCDVQANFTMNNNEICVGEAVFFTSQSTGSYTGFEWRILPNTNTFSTSPNPTYTFSQTGNYTIELKALKSNQCADIIQKQLKVQTADANFSYHINGLNVQFTAPENASDATYNWTFGDGNNSSNPTITHNYSTAGNYQICLTVNGCGNDNHCENLSLNLTNNCTDAPTIEWEQNFGGSSWEHLYSLQQTNDGGFILGGYSQSTDGDVGNNNGRWDYWIIKIDAVGNIQWEQNFGGSSDESFSCIQQTNDGGFILGGSSYSIDGDVGSNNGEDDFWIIKIDAVGNLQWEQNFGGSSHDFFKTLQQTKDEGYILGGESWSIDGDVGENNGSADLWIVKIDALGNLQWEQNFGGSNSDRFSDLQHTSDNGYILGGYSMSNDGEVEGNNGERDFWIVKIDINGNLQWEQNFGGSSNDRLKSLQQTNDEGFILGGSTYSNDGDVGENSGSTDFWIIKTDALGNLQWEQNFGGSNADYLYSLQQTNDGGFILGGDTPSNDGDIENNYGERDFWIIKTDALGNLQWEQNFGGSDDDWFRYLQQTNDGGYILGGYSRSNDGDVGDNNGDYDYWIVKLSPTCSTNCLASDSLILVNFYNNTNGPNWTNTWDVSQPVSTWYGVTLSTNGCNVTGLNIANNGLNGCYMDGLCTLNLSSYDFSDNALPDNGSPTGFQGFCEGDVSCVETNYPVVPGDVSFDGVANYQDVPALGLVFGLQGTTRVAQDIVWEPHLSDNWGVLQENGRDAKHADTDGNGIVDLEDLFAIEQNYGETHNEAPTSSSNNYTDSPIEMYLQPTVIPSLEGNDNMIEYDIMVINTEANDVALYGGHFSITYDNPDGYIEEVNAQINTSWLGIPQQDLYSIVHKDTDAQVVEVGFTGIDHSDKIGNGSIGKLFACINNDTPPWDSLDITFDISNININNSQADALPIATNSTTIGFDDDTDCVNHRIITYSSLPVNAQVTKVANNLIETSGNVQVATGQKVELKSNETHINENFQVLTGGVLEVYNDPCGTGSKPINASIQRRVFRWSKDTDQIVIDYDLSQEVEVFLEVLTLEKQKVKHLYLGSQTIGSQQLQLNRSELPTGKLLVCLKKGRKRYYNYIEN